MVACVDPYPDVFSSLASLRPPPTSCPFLKSGLCVCYWQEALTASLDRKRRLNMVLERNVGEQPRSFVHSPASSPALQWAIQTSESLDKGRLCPPICQLHPALLLPPILPFSPSCCTSSASLFSLAGPRPRIAQQVLSENRCWQGQAPSLLSHLLVPLCFSLPDRIAPLLQKVIS